MIRSNVYNIPEIEKILDSMVITIDTREQETSLFKRRVSAFDYPYIKKKLDFGDYSAECICPNGKILSMSEIAAVERKMNLAELANCFCSERKRFQNEFKRAGNAGCHMHLLIEDGSYEKMMNGQYRSQFNPNSFLASWLTWSVRYNIQLHFCKQETTPKLIQNILRYELREYLLKEGG